MSKPKKYATSIRLSPEAKRLISELAKKLGVSQSAILEIAIRRLAEQEKIK
jgi:predicted transcriptional regulator